MVRLNFPSNLRSNSSFNLFQFQNGTIKFFEKIPLQFDVVMFQFQNGTIKFETLFSSSKYSLLFQFQNGTIKLC